MNHSITAVIVDDESDSRFVLATLLNSYFTEVAIIGEAGDISEAFELINRVKPQLVFLDIQMPKGGGFDLLKKFGDIPFEVVFVTSYDQYAINAIRFSALDYLLKPVEVADLRLAVKRAVDQISEKRNNQAQVVNLLHSMDSLPESHKIAVHVADSVKLLEGQSIITIQGDGNYCSIQTDTGERFVCARYLKDFEEYFGPDSSFIRISKSILVNTEKIMRYSKGQPYMVEMANGEVFEVARRRKTEIIAKLTQNRVLRS